MTSIPPVPPDVLDAERGFQADQRWHRFAFAILPPPFGNRKRLDVGCGGGGVAAHEAGTGWHVTGIDISRWESLFADRFVWLLAKTS